MEKRFIDANALRKLIANEIRTAEEIGTHDADVCKASLMMAVAYINIAPTVDAALRWIPCEEKLPEQEEKAYLVYLEDGHICDCKWWCRNLISLEPTEQWRWDIFDLPQYGRVLAWMPLPEPYDGERSK